MSLESSNPKQTARFDAYEVDFHAGRLFKHGVNIKLQDQPFRILEFLLERPGQVTAREELIGRLWPEGTFVDYEHGLNAAVAKLRHALSDSAEQPVYIETVGRRGYRFIGHVESPASTVPVPRVEIPQEVTPRRHASKMWPALAGILTLAVAASLYYIQSAKRSIPLMTAMPLTSYLGKLGCAASFSPDGSQMAFAWQPQGAEHVDIYARLVNGGDPLKLSHGLTDSWLPAWSPDGSQIAFNRGDFVFLISPLGGPERKLTTGQLAGSSSWTPDGKSLIILDRSSEKNSWAIYSVAVTTLQRRKLTFPPALAFDSWAALSPDGTKLAFIRSNKGVRGSGPIYILLLRQGVPDGEAWRLTPHGWIAGTLAWLPSGREVIFDSNHGGHSGLWRTFVSSTAKPQPLLDTQDAACPTISKGVPVRLAFFRSKTGGFKIWTSEMPIPGKTVQPVLLIASTENDCSAQYSPDGQNIVFASNRSGAWEIWACRSDGSHPKQLTNFGGVFLGSPRWSADGSLIAFDGIQAPGDTFNIFAVSAEGGSHRRFTDGHSIDARPSWSHDGRWIYYSSNRSGTTQVWRIPSEGGKPMQITRGGGFEAIESHDGKTLYYVNTTSFADKGLGLWQVSVGGGTERQIAGSVWNGNWSVIDKGIYWLDFPAASASQVIALKFFNFETKQITQAGSVGPIGVSGGPNFSVTPDGRRVLWGRLEEGESELMTIEDFR